MQTWTVITIVLGGFVLGFLTCLVLVRFVALPRMLGAPLGSAMWDDLFTRLMSDPGLRTGTVASVYQMHQAAKHPAKPIPKHYAT